MVCRSLIRVCMKKKRKTYARVRRLNIISLNSFKVSGRGPQRAPHCAELCSKVSEESPLSPTLSSSICPARAIV